MLYVQNVQTFLIVGHMLKCIWHGRPQTDGTKLTFFSWIHLLEVLSQSHLFLKLETLMPALSLTEILDNEVVNLQKNAKSLSRCANSARCPRAKKNWAQVHILSPGHTLGISAIHSVHCCTDCFPFTSLHHPHDRSFWTVNVTRILF